MDERFLGKFTAIDEGDLLEPVEGPVAILRLVGPDCALDLVNVYMPTGDAEPERSRIRDSIRTHLRPQDEALTVIIGDWNFARDRDGIFNADLAEWTGMGDTRDHHNLEEQLLKHFDLVEGRQDEMTHKRSRGLSRVDCLYLNPHLADQACKPWTVAALFCPGDLSLTGR